MLAILDRRGRQVSVLTVGGLALVTIELASTVTMLMVATLAAPRGDVWPASIVAVLAALAITLPDSEAGLVTLLAYGGWWFAADRSASWGATLVAALAGLAFHLALAQAAAAPAGVVTRLPVVRALLIDGAVVVLMTSVAALVLAAFRSDRLQAPTYVIGIALVLLSLLPWSAAYRDG